MKILRVESLISVGPFARSTEWIRLRKRIHKAIEAVDWPPGSGKFTIYPERGKRRGEGNGVTPIKEGLMKKLLADGWIREKTIALKREGRTPGGLDALLETKLGTIAIEWETGNISSSHRAVNKMLMYLWSGLLLAGMLIVPSRKFYVYLTDRVGNFDELTPYFDLWKNVDCKNGVLEIIEIEHDATSLSVPRIPKGKSGRASE